MLNDQAWIQRVHAARKVATIWLLCSVLILLFTLWFGQTSIAFFVATVFVGVLVTFIYLRAWKHESLLLHFVALFLILSAHQPLRWLTFPALPYGTINWWLHLQYYALILAIFCGTVLLYVSVSLVL